MKVQGRKACYTTEDWIRHYFWNIQYELGLKQVVKALERIAKDYCGSEL